MPGHTISFIRITITSALVVLLGCRDAPTASTTKPTSPTSRHVIVVTSRPLLDMTSAIVGDVADVRLVIPESTTSRHWQPTSDDVRRLREASVILISGAGYEPWKDRVSLPGSRTKDTAAGYYDQFIRIPDAVTHQHGPEGKHSHPGTVWATWLDPELAAAQLQTVTRSCVGLLPDHRAAIETASAKLTAELNACSQNLAALKHATKDGSPFVLADAPVDQYLTTRLGWPYQYLHWDDALASPTDEELAELKEQLAKAPADGARLFLTHRDYADAVLQPVNDAGLSIVRIDLCEAAAAEEMSLAKRLQANIDALKSTASSPGP